MKKFLKRFFVTISLVLAILLVAFYFYAALPFWGFPLSFLHRPNVPVTPAWALENWLWEDDVNTAGYVDELLDGYREHDIPVRTILIDSPWSTHYNNFEIDTTRYPNPEEWFGRLENEGYRVVLWMTSMVDSLSKDTAIKDARQWYSDAKRNGYLAGDGYKMSWWKGKGSFIDYTNSEAMRWWQGMQRRVLDLGVDGWKLDGTATFFSGKFFGLYFPYQKTFRGWRTTRQYMNNFYRNEYQFGRSVNPEFVTLSRSVDRLWAHPEGFAPLDAAPVCWVGDQEHTWQSDNDQPGDSSRTDDLVFEGIGGFETALRYVLASARKGYCVVGSDIAGFSGRTIPPRLYIRWAQFSTFCGLFLNGGHGERRLWKRSPEELEIIRKFSWLHTELVPYMYSHVVKCSRGGKPLQRPLRGDYQYLFGDDFFVAPIYKDSFRRKVKLPKGSWRYFFADSLRYEGGTVIERDYPLDEMPVYIRESAIVPLEVKRSYTGLGDKKSEGYITYLIYPRGESCFIHHATDGSGETDIRSVAQNNSLSVTLKDCLRPCILLIHSDRRPERISRDGQPLDGGDWEFRIDKKKIVIKSEEPGSHNYDIRF